jgi:hypothetical protein
MGLVAGVEHWIQGFHSGAAKSRIDGREHQHRNCERAHISVEHRVAGKQADAACLVVGEQLERPHFP